MASRTFDDVARITGSPLGFVAAVAAAGFALWFLFVRKKSPLNPENNATDASGNPVTAYKDVGGVLGWLGAGTNKVLCGYPASIGEAIGQNLPVFTSPNTSCNVSMCNIASCQYITGQGTACSDPVKGFIHADAFRYPAGKPLPTNAMTQERSGSIQSWSARPHQAGNNAAYAAAYESSPPDPAYTLNVLVADPKASYAGA